jgi:hypothetical protein
MASALPAATLNYTGAGGDLNLATTDGVTVTPGVTQFLIPVSDLYTVDLGDSITITINGLQYPYAGDLQATLTLMDNMNNVLKSGDIFDRIGKMSADPTDFGYATQFGNSGSIDSGNYVFDSSFTGVANDLWYTASNLGSSDSIPSGDYWTTGAFSEANNDLSRQFAGLLTQGTWVLTITDNYPPFTDPAPYTPGIVSWGLTLQATQVSGVPEPATLIPMTLSLGLFIWIRRRRRRV